MINLIKNNFYRYFSKKILLIVMFLITVGTILSAVYFTTQFKIRANIAIVSDQELSFNSPYVKITMLDAVPVQSETLLNLYDAVIVFDENGYEIITIKSDNYKEQIEKMILNPTENAFDENDIRGIGANIIGFLIMFMLFQGMIFMQNYSDDKEKGTLKRIYQSPKPIYTYIASMSLCNIIIVTLPALIVIAFVKYAMSVDIGFSLAIYSIIIISISTISTAFALFLSTIIRKADDVNTAGGSIIVLTSILSGSMFDFGGEKTFIHYLSNIMPQRWILNIALLIEQNKGFDSMLIYIVPLIVLTFALFTVSIIILNKKLEKYNI